VELYDQTKKKKGSLSAVASLPSNQENQTVELSKDAMSGTAAGNTQVLQKAQQGVLNQPDTSKLQKATQESAYNFVKNPMGDFDSQKYKQQRMEKSDVDWARSLDALQRQYGNVSGSGLLQQDMLNNVLQRNVDKGALESQIDQENYNRYIDSLTKSIGAGQSVGQQQEDMFSQRLGNLANVRQMAEGESAREFQGEQSAIDRAFQSEYLVQTQEGQQALAELQGKIQSGQMLQEQDFQRTMAEIENGYAMAMQNNDIEAAQDLEKLRGDLQIQAAEAQREWESSQSAIDRAFQSDYLAQTQEGQQALAELQGKIQSGQMLQEQDFARTMAEVENGYAIAMQNNDINAAEGLERLRGDLQIQAAEAQREWDADQRDLDRVWQTQERMGTEEFQQKMSDIEQRYALALQNNDIESAEKMASARNALELKMQTQDMGHDRAMLSIQSRLEEARAAKDVERQKDIAKYMSKLALDEMARANVYEKGMRNLDMRIQNEINQNNHNNAIAMMREKLAHETTERGLDRALEQARVELQGRSIDLQGQQLSFDQVMSLVENGTVDVDSAVSAVESSLPDGTTLERTSPDDIYKAVDEQLRQEMYEYGRRTGTLDVDASGNWTGTLTSAGLAAYNNLMTDTMFGEAGEVQNVEIAPDIQTRDGKLYGVTIEGVSDILRGADAENNPNNAQYNQLLSEAPTLNLSVSNRLLNKISTNAVGGGLFNKDGRLLAVSDTGDKSVSVVDVATGDKKTFRGKDNSIGDSLKNWVSGLKGV